MSKSSKAAKSQNSSEEVTEAKILLIKEFVNKVGSIDKAKEALSTLTEIREAA